MGTNLPRDPVVRMTAGSLLTPAANNLNVQGRTLFTPNKFSVVLSSAASVEKEVLVSGTGFALFYQPSRLIASGFYYAALIPFLRVKLNAPFNDSGSSGSNQYPDPEALFVPPSATTHVMYQTSYYTQTLPPNPWFIFEGIPFTKLYFKFDRVEPFDNGVEQWLQVVTFVSDSPTAKFER